MIRKGSIDGLIEEVGDAELLELALEDYERSMRRERSSRKDYVLGWLAAWRRAAGVRNASEVDLTLAV
jgi:hypothetical protein